jgi:hypothetical protein
MKRTLLSQVNRMKAKTVWRLPILNMPRQRS